MTAAVRAFGLAPAHGDVPCDRSSSFGKVGHVTDLQHPADSSRLPSAVSSPPHAGAHTRVRDVLLVLIGEWVHEIDSDELDRLHDEQPPVTDAGPFDLGHGLCIEKLPHVESELVMNACEPRGHFFISVRQFSARYAYVYEPSDDAVAENPYGWDPYGRILAALHLSRLVRDNADSMEYAARIVDYDDGQQQVIPRHDCELGRAYRLGAGRDWLDVDDAQTLRHLLDAYWNLEGQLPGRVRRALRRTAHLATERYVDDRLAEIAIALESLVNAGPGRVSRQFVDRVSVLGGELDVAGVSKNFARKMYRARSEGLHGGDVALFEHGSATPRNEALDQAARLEAVLRRAVRRALEDPAFRARFNDDATVDAWCPIPQNRSLWARTKAISWPVCLRARR